MVDNKYNPFFVPRTRDTSFGVINYEKSRYVTNRSSEHFFKKYQGFGISVSEISICKQNHVNEIVIWYHGKKENIIYSIELEMVEYCEIYDNNGDEQYIIPINKMIILGKEILGDFK